jgi:DNA-binding FadR family transcriptional regulator
MMLLDRQFHHALACATRNNVLAEILRNLHERSLRFWFILLHSPDRLHGILEQHRAIVRAIESRKPAAASAAMREHILASQQNVSISELDSSAMMFVQPNAKPTRRTKSASKSRRA